MSTATKKLKFCGLDTQYELASGVRQKRIHLDGAASPLPAKVAADTFAQLLPHYSNTHSHVHTSAQISSRAFDWARETILNFVGADNKEYACVFNGSGSTSPINRIARGLATERPERNIVLVSAMEHHANDLPHRQFGNTVHYIPLLGSDTDLGHIDLDRLESLLSLHQGKVNYIAFSSVSNVTGIANPVKEITKLAHNYDTFVVVDAAQSVAHLRTSLSDPDPTTEPDAIVFSGHKLYTPASPGVMIAKKSFLQNLPGQDLGGGSVNDVSYYDYELLEATAEREQSGTPNIIGAIALAKVANSMNELGFEHIEKHTQALNSYLKAGLLSNPSISVYGDPNLERISAIAFNHKNIDHGLLAAILNDYYGIAVRNECFCAHPYVSSLLKSELWEIDLTGIPENEQQKFINRKRGMVRVSTSIYNDIEDIDKLLTAISKIESDIDTLSKKYIARDDGSYYHKSFRVDWLSELGWSEGE